MKSGCAAISPKPRWGGSPSDSGPASRADAWPGRTLEGRVSFISSEAEFTPKNVQTEKERVKLVYRIKVTLPNPKGELKPGMPVDAVIMATP